MPARVVDTRARDAGTPRPFPHRVDPRDGFLELAPGPDDADKLLHRRGEIGVHRVWVLAALAPLERRKHPRRRRVDLAIVDARRLRDAFGVLGGVEAGTPTEDEEVRERVPAEPVRAMHARGDLARGEETRHGRLGRVRIDPDA